MTRRTNRPRIPIIEICVLVVFAVLPLFLGGFWVSFATRIMILAFLAISFDLVWSYAGVLSFGQAVFFGAAAYAAGLAARDLSITSLFVIVPLGMAVGAGLALLFAWLLLIGRRPPSLIFVSLGTLTASFAAERLARGWYYVGATNGIPSIPGLTIGPIELYPGTGFFYVVLAILVLVYLLCRFLMRSQLGLALAGVRENEARVGFLGYRVQHLKALVFALAGTVAGLGGSIYAFHEGFVWPNLFGVVMSTQAVLYVILGGGGTLIGAVVGVAAMEAVSYFLNDAYPMIWPILLGVLLLVLILFRPSGLIGFLVPRRERVGSFRRQPLPPA